MIDDVAARDAGPAAAAARTEPLKTRPTSPPIVQAADANGMEAPLGREKLEQTVEKLRQSIGQLNSSLRIEIDPETDRVVVKILDDRSGEVIRQIPSQEMVEIAKRLDAMQAMLLTKRT